MFTEIVRWIILILGFTTGAAVLVTFGMVIIQMIRYGIEAIQNREKKERV